MKSILDMNTQERRQYELDTFNAIMAARQATTATRQLPATNKRTIAIGRSVEGDVTIQPEVAAA